MLQLRFSNFSGSKVSRKTNALSSTLILAVALVALMVTGCKKESYTLTVTANPADAGTVTTIPAITGAVEEGTVIYVTQQPAVGYYFSEWTGDAEGTADTLEVVMNSNQTIVAEYMPGASESFDDGNADCFTDDESGRWAVNDTAYVMTGSGAGAWAYSAYNYDAFDNFEVSVDITVSGENTNLGNPVGIYFRSQSTVSRQNDYRVILSGEGEWYIARDVDGSYSFLQSWTTSADIFTGLDNTNNMKLICSGNTIEIYFNGVSQGTFTDDTFSSGYIGLLGYDAGSYTNTFIFDNFTVTPINIAEKKSAISNAALITESDQKRDDTQSR